MIQPRAQRRLRFSLAARLRGTGGGKFSSKREATLPAVLPSDRFAPSKPFSVGIFRGGGQRAAFLLAFLSFLRMAPSLEKKLPAKEEFELSGPKCFGKVKSKGPWVSYAEDVMSIVNFDAEAFDRATDGILRFLTPTQAEGLLQYRADPSLSARIAELAEKSSQGELTEEDRAEYEGYVRANKFIATLQAKARKLLKS